MPLIIERDVGESIIIDGPAVVRVVRKRHGNLALEITADASVNVTRPEILCPKCGARGKRVTDSPKEMRCQSCSHIWSLP